MPLWAYHHFRIMYVENRISYGDSEQDVFRLRRERPNVPR